MQLDDIEQTNEIFTVSRLNSEVRALLEESFAHVWVEGEISNFAAPASGHWYFSLKDASAQVRCAMFKGNQRKLGFTPKDGAHVLIRARVSLYENRGDFQLIADFMEERGEGKLRRAFEALKKKLEAAGLFDDEHKKSLPEFPRRIGVITSPTGAAIRDILHVLQRRYPCAPVIIYPTLVQGSTAAPAIVKAIEIANQRNECDILILARGGGSLEDLWPFNEEIVAKAVYDSALPIISGIGHEVDFTIADFVADYRAPTPSAAAEIATPDQLELSQQLIQQRQHLTRTISRSIASIQERLDWTQKHLAQLHPKRKLSEKAQHLDYCELTLLQLLSSKINRATLATQALDKRLQYAAPTKLILNKQHQLRSARQTLHNAITTRLAQHATALGNAAATLDALSPLATLRRGFAIASLNGNILKNTATVKVNDNIDVRLENGMLNCNVVKID